MTESSRAQADTNRVPNSSSSAADRVERRGPAGSALSPDQSTAGTGLTGRPITQSNLSLRAPAQVAAVLDGGGPWAAVQRSRADQVDPGDDPALISFHGEGVRSLEHLALIRRVLAVATAP